MTIDIMMPFYGDPGQFKAAVESVRRQSADNWRLTVIDDVYPDLEPGKWLASLADDRIRYIRNDSNLGVTGNFRRCVELAEQDHLVIMGCDDLMLPTYVERMTEVLAQFDRIAYVQPGVVVIDADGAPVLPLADRVKRAYRIRVDEPTIVDAESLATSLVRGNWTYFPSICWSREVMQSHGFADYTVVLDLALQLDILADGGRVVIDPRETFEYRRHDDSVSSWTAADGSRFAEEKTLLVGFADRARSLGWHRAEFAARRHLSSRLNAATRLHRALLARDWRGVRSLLRHILR